MTRKKEQRDMLILEIISGADHIGNVGMTIVDDYLLREKMENRREQGLPIPEEHAPETRTPYEISVWRSNKNLEECEGERCNKVMDEYPTDEDDFVPEPKGKTVEIL